MSFNRLFVSKVSRDFRWLVFLVSLAAFSQGLTPTTPAREFITVNGQVVAVENNPHSTSLPTAGYHYYRALTIDSTQLTADVTNFPVLLAQTIPNLNTVANGGHVRNANGYDILFTADGGGATRLNWEVESYDPVSGAIVAWIQVPTLHHGVKTTIYMFYANSSITTDQSNPAATWDGTFSAVYHFVPGTGFANDSTGHLNNGTVASPGPSSAAGQIAEGASFASGGYIAVQDSALLDNGTGSWEFWFRDDGPPVVPNGQALPRGADAIKVTPDGVQFVGDCAAVLTKADPHDSMNGIGFATCNGALFVQAKSGTAATQTPNLYTTAGWHHAAFTYSAGTSYAYYGDGASLGTGTLIPFSISSQPLRIGLSLSPGWPDSYIGSLDEVRISNVVRPATWVAAEYYNQSNPTAFVAYGTENAH